MLYAVIIFLIAFVLSFIFSGSEMGLYTVNRPRLRSRFEMGWPGAMHLRALVRYPQRAINTILIANNITHYIATACCTSILIGLGVTKRADLYSTAILAPLLVIFAEIMPKVIFMQRADPLMYRLSPFLRFSEHLFSPLLRIFDAMHSFISSFTGCEISGLKSHFTPERLRVFLNQSIEAGVLSPYQHKMVENVMRVKNVTVKQAFITLGEVVMLPDTASRQEITDTYRDNNFSRIPIYSENPGIITAIINFIDLFDSPAEADLSQLMRKPVYVNINDSVAHALYILQRSSQQMAVVLDETGDAAAGICTVKDLVEEIVGELYDW